MYCTSNERKKKAVLRFAQIFTQKNRSLQIWVNSFSSALCGRIRAGGVFFSRGITGLLNVDVRSCSPGPTNIIWWILGGVWPKCWEISWGEMEKKTDVSGNRGNAHLFGMVKLGWNWTTGEWCSVNQKQYGCGNTCPLRKDRSCETFLPPPCKSSVTDVRRTGL